MFSTSWGGSDISLVAAHLFTPGDFGDGKILSLLDYFVSVTLFPLFYPTFLEKGMGLDYCNQVPKALAEKYIWLHVMCCAELFTD